jgi:hypothetical protein
LQSTPLVFLSKAPPARFSAPSRPSILVSQAPVNAGSSHERVVLSSTCAPKAGRTVDPASQTSREIAIRPASNPTEIAQP